MTMSYWTIGFAAGGAVVLVVAVLLIGIIYQALRILRLARTASDVVGEIDANTRSIWALRDTNAVAEKILAGAREIDANAAAIVNAVSAGHDARAQA
jgi:hypothetical protein